MTRTAPIEVRAQPAIWHPEALGRTVVVDVPSTTDPGPTAHEIAPTVAAHLGRRAARLQVLPADAPSTPGSCQEATDLVVGITDGLGCADAAIRLAEHHRARLVLLVQGLPLQPAHPVVGRLRAADRLAVPSESFRHPLRAAGVPDVRIAHLPPLVGSAPSWLDRSDARRRLGWPERAFLAVHAGPLDLGQDLADVLAAAALLGPDRMIALTGDGPGRPVLERHAAVVRNVRVPRLDDEQQALALVAADVLLLSESTASGRLTSQHELARYLSAGRPVVASAPVSGGAAAELARTGGAGLVVPPGEPGRLAGALLALHADPTRRVAMGLSGIAYADAHLSRHAVLEVLDHIVDGALTGPPASVRLR